MRTACLPAMVALACVLAAAPAPAAVRRDAKALPDTGPVVLEQHPGTPLDSVARQLNARDLAAPEGGGGPPLVLTGSAPLAGPGREAALFVQLQSATLCGSAGCSTSVYLFEGGHWREVLDSVSGPISVSPARHRGMHDLIVNKLDRWEWTGSTYRDTKGGPSLHLRRSVESQRPGTIRRIDQGGHGAP